MSLYVFGIMVAISLFGITFEVLRRGIIQEKFSLVWSFISCFMLLIAIFPGIVNFLSQLIGIQASSNFIFFGALVFLFVLNIQVTFELGALLKRTQRLSEELAILNLKVKDRDS